ncbi:MAG: hypothetical protein ACRDPK_21120 [Carbonactinosporaceae bacterium]
MTNRWTDLVVVPAHVWDRDDMRDALRARDFPAFFKIVRKYTGRGQAPLGATTGVPQPRISSYVTGRHTPSVETWQRIADCLHMPANARRLLRVAEDAAVGDDAFSDASEQAEAGVDVEATSHPSETESVSRTLGYATSTCFQATKPTTGSQARPSSLAQTAADRRRVTVNPGDRAWRLGSPSELPEIDEMHRRELLRLLSMAGSLLVLPAAGGHTHRLDPETVDQYEALNGHLWRVFTLSQAKGATFPVVHEQLGVLIESLKQSHDSGARRRLCVLACDLFQLAGEIFFDSNQYTDAAYCYTLAADASKEASAFDLWACALTRHAFIGVYERRFDKAIPLLELAGRLAHRGDGALSTRYWVNAVQAEAYAGVGDLNSCERALDAAEQVQELNGTIHNGGWLRFDGSRLAEERGTCYVQLGRLDLAEASLNDALKQTLSARRRGGALTDLAMIGVQRRDTEQAVMNANAALDLARQTGSGVIARKLHSLQNHLASFLGDPRVRDVHEQIAILTV